VGSPRNLGRVNRRSSPDSVLGRAVLPRRLRRAPCASGLGPTIATVVAALSVLLAGCGGPGTAAGRGRATTVPRRAAPSEPSTPSAPSIPATQAGSAWLTYHHDATRSGDSPDGPAAVGLRALWTAPLDGQVYAEPLVDGQHVLVATENNTVYSLNAATGAIQWSAHLGSPVPASSLPCGDIDPSGITGTPVIDEGADVLWVVAFVEPGIHQLVALRVSDGQVLSRRTIDLSGVDPLAEQQRGALALDDGQVVVAFGGLFGDCGNYRGLLVALPTSGGDAQVTFAIPTAREGAIWAPAGPVVEPGGALLVATGNSASTTSYDGGNSVLRLSAALQLQDFFAPSNWAQLNESDLDLGSVSPTLVGTGLVFQVGKAGVGYLLDAGHLGGVGGQLAEATVCRGGAFGGTAVDGATVFVPCRNGLTAVAVGPADTLAPEWVAGPPAPGPPVVSRGVVWDVSRGGQLTGFDGATGRILVSQAVDPSATSFPSLAVGGGRLFVQAGRGVTAFGD